MSSNPEFPQSSYVAPDNAVLLDPGASPLESSGSLPENPAWSGWDVLRLALLSLVLMIAFLVAVTFVSKRTGCIVLNPFLDLAAACLK